MSSNNKVIVFDSSRITRRRVIERFKAPVGKYGKCDIIPHEAEIAEIINTSADFSDGEVAASGVSSLSRLTISCEKAFAFASSLLTLTNSAAAPSTKRMPQIIKSVEVILIIERFFIIWKSSF